MKISNFIIALILVGVVATTFILTTADLTSTYSIDYDNDTLEVFEDTAELHDLATDLEEKVNKQQTESGILDLVGNYIGRALDTLKLSTSAFSVFEKMSSKATEKLGLPSYFLTAFISIMLVLIIIGVIASAMIKRDL